MNFRTRFLNWMRGRNGMDDLARFESAFLLILLILSIFIRVLYIPSLLLLIHMYFRVFSKNTGKRRLENQKYCQLRYQFFVKWDKLKKRMEQRKTYRFFKCPTCKQTVRVPKGHGKICITCPKCREEFVKRT